VAFRRQNDEPISRTPLQPCRGSVTNNVYVAGMRAETEYLLRSELVNGTNVATGKWMSFQTGAVDADFPPVSVPIRHPAGARSDEPLLIHSVVALTGSRRPFATDLEGQIVWFSPGPFFLTRVLSDGHFLGYVDGANTVNDVQRQQVLREMDVAGNIVRETNIGRVAEQLESRGIHSDCRPGAKECVSGFHHEAIRLPNGHTLTIAGLERMFPAGTQRSKEPIDILGDLVVELDGDFQVTGVWNSFDHLDLTREAVDPGPCKQGPGADGCPAVFLAPEAREWLHSNALNYVLATGDFVISMPVQNWVAKVDWKNGKGSGKVLWRLGEQGDFTAKSSDSQPWFSGQHDSGFDPGQESVLSVFDNGHTRAGKDPGVHSRGQAWKLDEQERTATLVYNADLGVYSFAVGSAQRLTNGGYTFQAGFINPASVYTLAIETSPEGKVVYAQQLEGVIAYRSVRVSDLYSAPGK
jgi:hypothetical protein